MEAKELRFGNIVKIKGSIVVAVTGISKDGIVNYDASKSKSDINVSELEPVPLTDELLFKAGFEYDEHQVLYELNTVIIHLVGGKFYFRKHYLSNKEFEYEEIEIKYLHQLQNLYFALTGEELEINL